MACFASHLHPFLASNSPVSLPSLSNYCNSLCPLARSCFICIMSPSFFPPVLLPAAGMVGTSRADTQGLPELTHTTPAPTHLNPTRPLAHPHAGLAAIAIAAGGYHTCAIAAGGAVKCWGYNGQGQLGIGSYESQNRPTNVTGAAMY